MAGWHFQFRNYAVQADFEYYSSDRYKIYRQIQNTICKHNIPSIKNPDSIVRVLVPRTGFEPAHPFERCHLKAVRLPISPSGHSGLQIYMTIPKH